MKVMEFGFTTQLLAYDLIDPYFFTKVSNGKMLVFLVYVDDLLVMGHMNLKLISLRIPWSYFQNKKS